MNINLYITDNCPACTRAQNTITNLAGKTEAITLQVKNINDEKNSKVTIVPALFINDTLFSLGEVDTNKLIEYINRLNY